MEPVASNTKKHFMLSIMKSIFRLGGCYGLWLVGVEMEEQLLQAVALFFGIAEILGIAEEL